MDPDQTARMQTHYVGFVMARLICFSRNILAEIMDWSAQLSLSLIKMF
jgi:hypothetical protein